MIIHFLPRNDLITACGISTMGHEMPAITDRWYEVNCEDCKAARQ